MTGHELAKKLLELANLPIIGEEDGEIGYAWEIDIAEVKWYDGEFVYDDSGVNHNEPPIRKQVIHLHYDGNK